MTPERIRKAMEAIRDKQRLYVQTAASIKANLSELEMGLDETLKVFWAEWFGDVPFHAYTGLGGGCLTDEWDPYASIDEIQGLMPTTEGQWIESNKWIHEIYRREIEAKPAPVNLDRLKQFTQFLSALLGVRVEAKTIAIKEKPEKLRDFRDIQAANDDHEVVLVLHGTILRPGWEIGDDYWIVTLDGARCVYWETNGYHQGVDHFAGPGDWDLLEKFFSYAQSGEQNLELDRYRQDIEADWKERGF